MTDSKDPVIDPEVDYEKSLKKQRVVYKPTGGIIFSMIFDGAFQLFVIGIAVVLIANQITAPTINPITIIISSLAITFIISNFIFNRALIKIDGRNTTDNKADILLVMDEFFSSYDFRINNEQMMRSFKPSYQPIWGRIITILFDGETMYLNIVSLGKSNSPTWIHGLYNFIKAKRIAAYYKRHFNN